MYFNIAFSFFFSWSLVRFGECALCSTGCVAVSIAYLVLHGFSNSIKFATQIISQFGSPRFATHIAVIGAILTAVSSVSTDIFAVILAFGFGGGSVINFAVLQIISHFGDECCALVNAHILTVSIDSCCQGNDGQDG